MDNLTIKAAMKALQQGGTVVASIVKKPTATPVIWWSPVTS